MAHRSLTQHLKPHERIILAYDKATFDESDWSLLFRLIPHVGMVKVGMQAIATQIPRQGLVPSTSVAFQVVDAMQEHSGSIMYDGKFKDIGNTVGEAIKSLAVWSAPPKIATIHATMKVPSIVAALEASRNSKILVAGVTLLTDHDYEDAAEIYRDTPDAVVVDSVARLAAAVKETGVPAGMVSAPKELELVSEFNLIKITPNVRNKDAPIDDQNKNRSMTAAEAIAAGADYLVIGRPIMKHEDPLGAAQSITRQIESAL